MVWMTSQVLWELLRSPNGFIPSVLSANLTFLASSPNSFAYFASNLFHRLPSEGCRSLPSPLMCSTDACHDISLASSGFPNSARRRSITGRYHTDRARLFLYTYPSSSSSSGTAGICLVVFFFFCLLLAPCHPHRRDNQQSSCTDWRHSADSSASSHTCSDTGYSG